MKAIKIIKKVPFYHCALGPKSCKECLKASQKPKKFALIKVYLEPKEEHHPKTEIYVGCRRIAGEYSVIKRFSSKREAKDHAIRHHIEISFED